MAVLQSIPNIFDVAILILLIVVGMGILGKNILSVEEEVNEENTFAEYHKAIFNVYYLTSLTNYPGILKIYVESSIFYAAFFIPLVLLVVLIVLPIPIAVVFEKFRNSRTKILIDD